MNRLGVAVLALALVACSPSNPDPGGDIDAVSPTPTSETAWTFDLVRTEPGHASIGSVRYFRHKRTGECFINSGGNILMPVDEAYCDERK